MRARLFALLAVSLGGLAGCAGPDPAWDAIHAQSQQQAKAMLGKEYIFVAPAWVCRGQDQSAITAQLINPGCRTIFAGRFRVEDVVVLKNDGRTLLRIAGPEVAGFMPYEIYLPKPYRDAQDYFATGKGQ